MTTTINAEWVQNQLGVDNTKLSDERAEDLTDGVIDILNISMHTAISLLSGSAGSKSGSYSSANTGAIRILLREAYRRYKNPLGESGDNIGPVSSGVLTEPDMLNLAERLARRLNTAAEDPPLFVSNDPVPTE